jgi:dihydroceramidase
LTDGRRAVGLPVAFLLELHGWYVLGLLLSVTGLIRPRWHLLTAVGGYVAVALVDLLVSGDIRKDPIETLAWPVPFAARFMADVKE